MSRTASAFTELAGRIHAFIRASSDDPIAPVTTEAAPPSAAARRHLGGSGRDPSERREDTAPAAVGQPEPPGRRRSIAEVATVARETEFNTLALALFALQSQHNPALRALANARTAAQPPAHWREIRPVPVAAFKELEVTVLPSEARTTVFHSSGTTGQIPSRHFHSAESLRLYEASLLPWFRRHLHADSTDANPKPEPQQLFLTPSPQAAPHSSLAHMFGTIAAASRGARAAFLGRVDADGAWNLDFENALTQLRVAAASDSPVIVFGTAFLFVHLLDQLAAQNTVVKLPVGSRVLETGGYKGRSRTLPKVELHREITRRLGVPPSHLVCEYGMSELSSQAYDTAVPARADEPRRFRFPPWARALIVSPETGSEVSDGETGLIRIYDLANVWSALAVQTEDLGVRRGDGFELLGRAALAEPRGCSRLTD